MKIKKGDKVRVRSGKDKGREGEVIRVLPQEKKVVVSGLNMVRRATKKTQEQPGGIVEKEAPLAASKVSVICPSCKKPSRFGKDRVCKNCGSEV